MSQERLAVGASGAARPDPVAAFVDRHYRRYPVTASFTGVTEYDHQLPDWTRAGREDACAELADLRPAFAGAPAASDEALAAAALDVEAAELASTHYYRRNPCLYTGEAIFGVISLMLRHHAPADERAGAMVTRLAMISGFLDTACIALDRPPPSMWIARAVSECAAAQDLFLTKLDMWCIEEGVPDSLRTDLNAVGAAAAVALAGFAGWLEAGSRSEHAACGEEHLTLLLRSAHWRSETPDELLELMHVELQRATEEWSAAAPDDSWSQVQRRLAERHAAPGAYLARFKEFWGVSRSTALQHAIVTWPDFPVEYHPMPGWARAAAPHLDFRLYRSPAAVGAPGVHRYLVPAIDDESTDDARKLLRTVNDWVIKSNYVVHHGGLGHHVRNAFARNGDSRIGRIAGINGSTRLALPCAGTLVEGWACYATDLMAEHGFFTEDELVAHKHARVRRVARAIADVELHLGRRTLQETLAFLVHATGLCQDAARREVTQTSMFPGTGTLCWLGANTLHDMRRTLASRFASWRDFHDRVLRDGAVPVALIRERMTAEQTG